MSESERERVSQSFSRQRLQLSGDEHLESLFILPTSMERCRRTMIRWVFLGESEVHGPDVNDGDVHRPF